jgi:tetratricopeptide (TPR) repeat protein
LFQGLLDEFPHEVSYRKGLVECLNGIINLGTVPRIGDSRIDTVRLRPIAEMAIEIGRSLPPGDPTLATGPGTLALLNVVEGRLDDAEANQRECIRFERAVVEKNPLSGTRGMLMRSCSTLARMLLLRDKLDEAEDWYREALKIGNGIKRDFPGMRDNESILGQIVIGFVALLQKQARIDDAMAVVAELTPRTADRFASRAALYKSLGKEELAEADYQEAVDRSSRAIKFDPTDKQAYDALFNSLSGLGRRDEALALVRNMVASDIESMATRVNLYGQFSAAELTSQDTQVIIGLWTRIADVFPTDYLALQRRSEIHLQQKQYKHALSVATKLIELDPNNPNSWWLRGTIYFELKQFDLAIENISEAIRLNPRWTIVVTDRGDTYFAMGRYNKAIADYHTALSFEPNGWQPRIALAWLLATAREDQYRDGQQAVGLAQQTYDAGKFGTVDQPRILSILAAAHAEDGNFDKAIDYCQNAIALAQKGSELADELPFQLSSYQAGRPWRSGGEE